MLAIIDSLDEFIKQLDLIEFFTVLASNLQPSDSFEGIPNLHFYDHSISNSEQFNPDLDPKTTSSTSYPFTFPSQVITNKK